MEVWDPCLCRRGQELFRHPANLQVAETLRLAWPHVRHGYWLGRDENLASVSWHSTFHTCRWWYRPRRQVVNMARLAASEFDQGPESQCWFAGGNCSL